MKDPKLTIMELIRDNWDNTNTSIAYDPDVHTGWHSEDANNPQVTVSSASETPINGGATGFAAIDPTGAGGYQEIDGTVQVDCWSDRDVEGSVNPKRLTFEFTEEVKRILKTATRTATDLRYISYGGRNEIPPGPDENPPRFHYNVPVGYIYGERP